MDVLSQAMYHARELAMTRMEEEADQLGATGWSVSGSTSAATNGASTWPSSSRSAPRCKHREGELHRAPNGRPFTSDLSGQDFWTLLPPATGRSGS